MGNNGYSASKAAFGRVAGGIEAEFGPKGVRGFNVDPGHVVTESVLARHGKDPFGGRLLAAQFGFGRSYGGRCDVAVHPFGGLGSCWGLDICAGVMRGTKLLEGLGPDPGATAC